MTLPFLREFKLAREDGDGLDPRLDQGGVRLGDTALLERDHQGQWRTRPRDVLERLLTVGYAGQGDVGRRIDALASVARALNAGDPVRAALTLVHAELPPLPDADHARRMAEADALLKYSPDQPRVPAGGPGGGEWTGNNDDRTSRGHGSTGAPHKQGRVTFKGDATYYNNIGRQTAYGKLFDPNALSAAMYQPGSIEGGGTVSVKMNDFPFNSIDVTVDDTGPFERNVNGLPAYPLRADPRTVIDLTPRVFRELTGSLAVGRVSVTVTKVNPSH